MQKIVIVSLFGVAEHGGIERVSFYLNSILEQKFDVELLHIKRSFGKLDFIIYPLWFSLLLYFKKTDLVISQAWHSFLYPSDIVICHGTTQGAMERVISDRTLGARYIALLERISFKLAKHVWAVSNNAKDELIHLYHVNSNKVKVVNNFVDENIFFPIATKETTKCRIIFSGRLNYRKGADKILELSKYIEARDDVELIVACNDRTGVAEFANFKNTKVCTGLEISQMRNFYNSGDVFYFPTRYEGFSMAVLEALSCGIPIIGTRYALPKEMNDLEFTYRVNDETPEDIADIAIKLKLQYANEKQSLHQFVIKMFGKQQYITHVYNEIDRIVYQSNE